MEAVPRMPMIWLELKEAGEFHFSSGVVQYIKRNYGENPENYSEALRKLEKLRQHVVNISRDFEGCNILRKYFGQLHFLQSRVPMAKGREAAAPVTWIDIFSGKQVTHEDISYEQACVLYNLGALHSYLGAMDNRVSEEGMKTSCTHFQSSAGAFTYIRDYYNSGYSSDLGHPALSINISLMLGQAQECLLEKTLLDNRKSFLIARISAQVCDYYRECTRVLESSECVSGKKEWRKLLWMKISYFSAVTHLHMGKHSEEQQKHGEAVAYFRCALGKLNEAIKLSKGQPESVQEALKFTMDIIGGKFNSAKKDNDFIYHESVPGLDMLPAVKGASLVKPLPVSPTDPNSTGPDLFSKLVPLAAHEFSSVYSEEKAKLLREVMAKIDEKNQILGRFMDSLNCVSVDLDMFSSVPPVLLEKCAALSVQPDAVKRLVQAMQALSSVYTDVGSYLEEVRNALEEVEAGDKALLNVVGQKELPPRPPELMELQNEFRKYEAAHQAASQTNTDLHKAMNQHIPNLRLLQGPLDELRNSLAQPQLTEDDKSSLQTMKRICGKVDEMRKQRISFEKELRDLIQKDDITTILVTTERSEIKLQKYDQLKGYIDQNLAAQDNIIKALTEANVQCATIRKTLSVAQEQWNCSVQSMVASYEAYENLVKKAEEGTSFYQDLGKKTSSLLDKIKTICKGREERSALMKKEVLKVPPPRPSARKPVLDNKIPGPQSGTSNMEPSDSSQDLPQKLHSLPPNMALARGPPAPLNWPPGAVRPPFLNQGMPQLIPTNQPPYGPLIGVPQPLAPIQHPSGFAVPQQFQPGPPGGIPPVPSQINPQNMSQMPHQGFMPAPWQNARPGLPGNVLMYGGQGQNMPATMPQSSSNQPVTPGTQYQGYPPPPTHGIISQANRVGFFGQSQPSSHSGQFHSPVPPQSQSQPMPPTAYWPTIGVNTQCQPDLPVQPGLVSVPGEAKMQPFPPGPVNQFHPGQSQPQAQMGNALSSMLSSQPQQMPGSLQNTTLSQTTTQVPFSQNQPTYHSFDNTHMPQRIAPPEGNIYFQSGTPHSQAQPLNTSQQPTAQLSNMFQTGNPLQTQHIPSPSGPCIVPVMDNPNPPALTGILTPSPAHPLPYNQTGSVLKPSSSENSFSVLQDKVNQLSIASQGAGSDCGEDKIK
ncbi:tyrosine-protein phosphatase non-receptor type 23b isoform X2 [Hemibagrus wyckioides]|uniref:tyrosine-protein phosphatase non-receptor type 23b isoform X2 n=1 Tax=Hemibagrus wyckioides TaxID=337641 RepID=UPI00266D3048|nr:tyrosine-protein phosphatase non-receptor type 23b isoform X2 [Hemibagrus wyckioides]